MQISVVTRPCPVCHKYSEVEVDDTSYILWQNGMFVQDAFPEMSIDTRELLITGTHPVCWEAMFSEGEDD